MTILSSTNNGKRLLLLCVYDQIFITTPFTESTCSENCWQAILSYYCRILILKYGLLILQMFYLNTVSEWLYITPVRLNLCPTFCTNDRCVCMSASCHDKIDISCHLLLQMFRHKCSIIYLSKYALLTLYFRLYENYQHYNYIHASRLENILVV